MIKNWHAAWQRGEEKGAAPAAHTKRPSAAEMMATRPAAPTNVTRHTSKAMTHREQLGGADEQRWGPIHLQLKRRSRDHRWLRTAAAPPPPPPHPPRRRRGGGDEQRRRQQWRTRGGACAEHRGRSRGICLKVCHFWLSLVVAGPRRRRRHTRTATSGFFSISRMQVSPGTAFKTCGCCSRP